MHTWEGLWPKFQPLITLRGFNRFLSNLHCLSVYKRTTNQIVTILFARAR